MLRDLQTAPLKLTSRAYIFSYIALRELWVDFTGCMKFWNSPRNNFSKNDVLSSQVVFSICVNCVIRYSIELLEPIAANAASTLSIYSIRIFPNSHVLFRRLFFRVSLCSTEGRYLIVAKQKDHKNDLWRCISWTRKVARTVYSASAHLWKRFCASLIMDSEKCCHIIRFPWKLKQ